MRTVKQIFCLNLFFIVIFFAFANTAFSQWVQQVSGVSTSLLDIDFINENTGWGCGDNGVIVKTTNGGVNWVQQSTGVTNRLEGIDAVDPNLLWCVGWWNTILKSTNGGANWQVIRCEPTPVPTFRKVYFLNANTGWLLKSNYILRTTNGGSTFDSTHTVFTYLWDIYFKNSSTGVLCGDGALIMKSTDSGITWNQIIPPLLMDAPNLYRLSFVGDIGWTIGNGDNSGLGKLVFRTTNFGSSWDSIARIQYPSGEQNYAVCFANITTGYAGGTSGIIYKTTNGGINWLRQNTPSNGFRNDFWFANDSLGWSTGGGGHIYKTTNGGTYLSVEPISNSVPDDFVLYQNYPNPFNPVTYIRFQLLRLTFVQLVIYDILGNEVSVVVNENLKAGTYKTEWNASAYPSGTYFYRLISDGNTIDSKKMILIK